MVLPLSSSYIEAKNRLNDQEPWIILAEIRFGPNPEEILRICQNTNDITWNNETWFAFPFELETIKESGKSEVQRVVAKVSNINKAVQYLLEQHKGGVGATLTFHIVYSGDLSEVATVPSFEFEVIGSKCDSRFATFTLGSISPYKKPDPIDRMLKNFCRYDFPYSVDPRCPYTGTSYTTCNKTLEDCMERNGDNSKYAGLFPMLGENVIYV